MFSGWGKVMLHASQFLKSWINHHLSGFESTSSGKGILAGGRSRDSAEEWISS